MATRVAAAPNPDLVGIAGRVVGETAGTLRVAGESSRVRQVPKRGTVFEFAITDEAAVTREGTGTAFEPATAGEGAAHVTVDGSRLLSRPAERTENGGDSHWR
ncbi:ribonuclease P [Halobacteriales archaeon SW_7_68_16]|nr:MAG: ribonuclease P [Halobacteriales archaeon SW_7_68_16]